MASVESGKPQEDEARAEIEKLEEQFKVEFSALLNEEQLKKMLELQENGTLGDRWW